MKMLLIRFATLSRKLPSAGRRCGGVLSMTGSLNAQAPNPAGANASKYNIAVVDISYIFKKHERFKATMEAMKKEMEGIETELKADREKIAQQEQAAQHIQRRLAGIQEARRRSRPQDGRVQSEDGQASQRLLGARSQGLLPDLSRSRRRREVLRQAPGHRPGACASTASRSIRIAAKTCSARSTSRSSCRIRSTSRRTFSRCSIAISNGAAAPAQAASRRRLPVRSSRRGNRRV